MNEADAQRVLLVRAIEMTDTRHSVWSRENRQWATETAHRESSAGAGADGRDAEDIFLARRAALACTRMEDEYPEVVRARRAVRWPRWSGWAIPLVAFLLGFAANELGPDRRINIISFPLLGMLAWNVGVYAVMLVRAIARAVRSQPPGAPGLLTRVLLRIAQRAGPEHAQAEPLARGLRRFIADWSRVSSGLNAARVRAVLHASAALLAAGAVAGLYARGLGLEYLAGWESTFLTEHAVHRLLNGVLGPASALSGIAIPGAEGLAALRWSAAQPGENAAAWIHLYALTAALFIVAPRLALALWSAISARRLQHSLPFAVNGDPYFRRLLAARQGKGEVVRVIPHSYHPSARTKEALEALFTELHGARARIELTAPIAFGDEENYFGGSVRSEEGAPDYLVVLFNIASTPEDESQGALIAAFQRALREAGETSRLLIVLNESPYRQQFGGHGDMEPRLAERRQTWESMLRRYGVEAVSLDLDADDAAAAAMRVEALTVPDAPRRAVR